MPTCVVDKVNIHPPALSSSLAKFRTAVFNAIASGCWFMIALAAVNESELTIVILEDGLLGHDA